MFYGFEDGILYGKLDGPLPSKFVIPAAISTKNPSVPFATSPKISNFIAPRGLLGSIGLIGQNTNLNSRFESYLSNEFFVASLPYNENNLETHYFIGFGEDSGINIDFLGGITDLAEAIGKILGLIFSGHDQLTPPTAGQLQQILQNLQQANMDLTTVLSGLGTTVESTICNLLNGLGSGASNLAGHVPGCSVPSSVSSPSTITAPSTSLTDSILPPPSSSIVSVAVTSSSGSTFAQPSTSM